MNTEIAFSPDEQLLQWLLKVARRADELSGRTRVVEPGAARRVWLRAEFEIFEWAERAAPTALLVVGLT